MRIAIDARFWGTKSKGLGRYTQELVRRLPIFDPETEFTILLQSENFEAYHPQTDKITKVRADFRWYTFAEQRDLPKLLKSLHCDLVHFPHFNVPLLAPRPFVVTIHDLILSRHPSTRATTLGSVRYAFKQAAYHLTIRRALFRSEHIMTISHFTEKDIMQTYSIPKSKISVAYEGVTALGGKPGAEAVLEKHHITKPYFLYVGNAYPHKNLERLARSFFGAKKNGIPHQLVCVGQKDYFYDRLQKYVNHQRIPDVIFPGYVTDDELYALYANADWYVFPSLYEGFGLPPLEAMQAGAPVLASNSSCLPEVLGDAARYFSPYHEHDMIQALISAVTDRQDRERCRERSKHILQRYSWDTMCQRTVDMYHNVLSNISHANSS